MPFSIFVAVSILGLDLIIYVLFKLLYGDKRKAIARQVAAHRNAGETQPPRPFLVSPRKAAPASHYTRTAADFKQASPPPERPLVRHAS